ncbi:MAG: TonB-dependent receptor [Acidobacteriota bacterium]
MRYLAPVTSRITQLLLLAFLVVSISALPAIAQGEQSGTLAGAVKDTSGEALPGVTVTVSSPSLLGERVAYSGSTGEYIIRGLPPGSYKVVFELSGMTTVERTATLELGRTSRSDANLDISPVEDTIVVVGETPTALSTTTIGANYDSETIDNLATSRTLFGIAQLAPGLSTNTPNGGQVTIGGAFAYDNVFLVDGVDTNDNLFGSSNALFIEDAIEETQVLTSGISAEYGRFTGGVINAITKSGGNEFSGSLRVDLTNSSWRDETPLEDQQGIEREDDVNEVYQATLGGYILQDKLWFFLAGRDSATSSQHVFAVTSVPTTRSTDNERQELKLTGNLSNSHTLQGTYIENDATVVRPSFGFSVDPRVVKAETFPNELMVGRYNGVLTPNLFGELQYSEKTFQFASSGGTSTDIVDSPFLGFSPSFTHYNAPYFDATDPEDRDNQQLAGSLSYFIATEGLGSHDLKGGFEQFTSTNTGGNSQSPTDFVFEASFLVDNQNRPIYDDLGRLQPVFVPGSTILENWLAERGASIDIETASIYINDRWSLNDHWSFNLGVRHEEVSGSASNGLNPVDTSRTVPRLAASYDVHGDGRYKVDATYAQYAGKYSEAQFAQTTNVGNPDSIYSYYIGPAGVGLDFAPGLDPDNYVPYRVDFPTQNVFFDSGLSSPVVDEVTLSIGAELGRGGYGKLTYTNRETSDFVEDFINSPGAPIVIDSPVGDLQADRIVFRNSNLPERAYEALQLQGRYRLANNWSVEGHWTHQLKNEGNFEGEGANTPGVSSLLGDYPEVLSAERHFPTGRLNDYQRDRVRLWTTYNLALGRAGNLGLSLLYRYDSASTYSLSRQRSPLSAELLAQDPGYANLPRTATLFFGERGSQDFGDQSVFDFSANYALPLWRSVEPWVKVEVRNLLNNDDVITFNTDVFPVANGPVDSDGLPTTFTRGATFGEAEINADFVTPLEYRLSAGIRF